MTIDDEQFDPNHDETFRLKRIASREQLDEDVSRSEERYRNAVSKEEDQKAVQSAEVVAGRIVEDILARASEITQTLRLSDRQISLLEKLDQIGVGKRSFLVQREMSEREDATPRISLNWDTAHKAAKTDRVRFSLRWDVREEKPKGITIEGSVYERGIHSIPAVDLLTLENESENVDRIMQHFGYTEELEGIKTEVSLTEDKGQFSVMHTFEDGGTLETKYTRILSSPDAPYVMYGCNTETNETSR